MDTMEALAFATVITKRDAINQAFDLWEEVFPAEMWAGKTMGDGVKYEDILARRAALDLDTCSRADLAAALGATSTGSKAWGYLACGVCKEEVDRVLDLYAFPYAPHLCENCLKVFIELLSFCKDV